MNLFPHDCISTMSIKIISDKSALKMLTTSLEKEEHKKKGKGNQREKSKALLERRSCQVVQAVCSMVKEKYFKCNHGMI